MGKHINIGFSTSISVDLANPCLWNWGRLAGWHAETIPTVHDCAVLKTPEVLKLPKDGKGIEPFNLLWYQNKLQYVHIGLKSQSLSSTTKQYLHSQAAEK